MVSRRLACTTLTSKSTSTAGFGDILTCTKGRNWPGYGDGFGAYWKRHTHTSVI
jgi:hypothetical protein